MTSNLERLEPKPVRWTNASPFLSWREEEPNQLHLRSADRDEVGKSGICPKRGRVEQPGVRQSAEAELTNEDARTRRLSRGFAFRRCSRNPAYLDFRTKARLVKCLWPGSAVSNFGRPQGEREDKGDMDVPSCPRQDCSRQSHPICSRH
jgi:hypothetical protein